MKKIFKLLLMAIFIGTSSCVIAGPNSDVGTVIGGIAGGVLGHNVGHGSGRTAATIGGAVIGSLVGKQVGHSVDQTDRYGVPCPPPGTWEARHYPCSYPPRYHHTFIGPDGRLCRHAVLFNEDGDRIYATYCCFRMTPDGFCRRWVQVN